MESVNRVARRSNEPGLRRVSQDLNLVRNSIKLARASMGSTGVCAGMLRWCCRTDVSWLCMKQFLSFAWPERLCGQHSSEAQRLVCTEVLLVSEAVLTFAPLFCVVLLSCRQGHRPGGWCALSRC